MSPALAEALLPIGRFAAAVKSGSVQQIKEAYPGLSDSQRKNWEILFSNYKPESAEIVGLRGVAGPDANGITVVDFTMVLEVSEGKTGNRVVIPSTRYRARLKRQGPVLVLESLMARPGSR